MDLITVWNPQRHMYEMRSKSGKVCIETGKCMKTKQREKLEEVGAGVKLYQLTDSDMKKTRKKNSTKLHNILANAKAVSGSGLMIL
jgi:hypothetical protein